MGDFERTLGAGADFDRIVDKFSRQERQPMGERSVRTPEKEIYFSTYDEVIAWDAANPKAKFTGSRQGDGYLMKITE